MGVTSKKGSLRHRTASMTAVANILSSSSGGGLEDEVLVRVALVGDAKVGKSSLVTRIVQDKFSEVSELLLLLSLFETNLSPVEQCLLSNFLRFV